MILKKINEDSYLVELEALKRKNKESYTKVTNFMKFGAEYKSFETLFTKNGKPLIQKVYKKFELTNPVNTIGYELFDYSGKKLDQIALIKEAKEKSKPIEKKEDHPEVLSLFSLLDKQEENHSHEDLDKIWRHFLIHSYLYYQLDKPVIPDSRYDELCKILASRYFLLKRSEVLSHKELRQKEFISKDMFEAGSGYALAPTDYPRITVDTANQILKGVINV